ncbi:MAG: molecular chaperone [Ramlibacter sp.]|nr:molecular chaperone [Ramlibacter sp.]
MSYPRAPILVTAFVLLFSSVPSIAGVFSVAPVRIFMGPRDRAVAVTIVNEAATALVLETQLSAWSQRPDGTDELTPTDELVLAPPIITIPAKTQQVVRLALLRALDPSKQLTYRLLLREVPEATAPGPQGVEIPVALAMNLPIFVSPPNARRTIACSTVQRSVKGISVSCNNSGNAYGQIREASLRQSSTELARFQGGGYVLPGVAKQFPLTQLTEGSTVPAGKAELHVSFDDGQTQVFDVLVP